MDAIIDWAERNNICVAGGVMPYDDYRAWWEEEMRERIKEENDDCEE